MKTIPKLCLIADCDAVQNHLPRTMDIIGEHPVWIMVRDKEATADALNHAIDNVLKKIYYHPNAKMTLNGGGDMLADILPNHPYLGAHLPSHYDWTAERQKYPRTFMGASLHCMDDVGRARDAGMNYVTVSPIFATASHPDASPMEGGERTEILKSLACFTVALGGIDGHTIETAVDMGFNSYASIRGWQNDVSLQKMINVLYRNG